jgi:predicted metalloprotease with PDZ domain
MDNDSLFKAMLREMNRRFRHGIVTSAEVEGFINQFSGRDLSKVFDQYLRTTEIPVLQWGVRKGKLYVRWTDCVAGLSMPILITVNGEQRRVAISDRWSSPAHGLDPRTATLVPDMNWYVGVEQIGGAALKRALRQR